MYNLQTIKIPFPSISLLNLTPDDLFSELSAESFDNLLWLLGILAGLGGSWTDFRFCLLTSRFWRLS